MAAFGAGPGMVGNLIGRHAVTLGDFLGCLIKHGRMLAIRHDELTGLVQAVERRAFLDGQLVERQMVDGIGDGLLELRVPFGDGLVRAGIDEIEGHTRKNLPRQPNGFQGIGNIMQAAEELQVPVVERLHAE
ncbi:hypothetical protein D3C72_1377420 [compost metagenome]